MKFIFDLDGTITRQESLPLLADHFGRSDQMTQLTQQAVTGAVPFEPSFRQRIDAFREVSVEAVSRRLEMLECWDALVRFIQDHPADCAIATANLDVWIDRLVARFGCPVFSSTALVRADRVAQVADILRKEDVVRLYQERGDKVVFIGDGAHDAPAMVQADFAIACGLLHPPAPDVLAVSDVAVSSEVALIAQLEALKTAKNP